MEENGKYRLLGVVTACVMVLCQHVQARQNRRKLQQMRSRRRFRCLGHSSQIFSMETIPEYDGEPYVVIEMTMSQILRKKNCSQKHMRHMEHWMHLGVAVLQRQVSGRD